MDNDQSLNHTRWECKYHVVWIPKYRRKELFGKLRQELGSLFKDLAQRQESQVLEGHLLPDHVHMLISIPPKYAVSQVIGFIKGKSAIQIARVFLGRRKNFVEMGSGLAILHSCPRLRRFSTRLIARLMLV